MFALAVNEQIICFFKTFPAFVAVHCIVTADNRSDHAGTLGAVVLHLSEETGTAFGIGIAAVHESMKIDLVESILLGCVAKGIKMVER